MNPRIAEPIRANAVLIDSCFVSRTLKMAITPDANGCSKFNPCASRIASNDAIVILIVLTVMFIR